MCVYRVVCVYCCTHLCVLPSLPSMKTISSHRGGRRFSHSDSATFTYSKTKHNTEQYSIVQYTVDTMRYVGFSSFRDKQQRAGSQAVFSHTVLPKSQEADTGRACSCTRLTACLRTGFTYRFTYTHILAVAICTYGTVPMLN